MLHRLDSPVCPDHRPANASLCPSTAVGNRADRVPRTSANGTPAGTGGGRAPGLKTVVLEAMLRWGEEHPPRA